MKNLTIKIISTLLVLNFLWTGKLYSQVTAGSVPSGTSIIQNVVNLKIIEDYKDTITYLDIDGDGSQDIKIWFMKYPPAVDGANFVAFFTMNNSFSFCINSWLPRKTTLYELGDTLCTTNHEWGVDSFYLIGCYGGWFCTLDTSSINNKYVAYRKNATGEIGWIKVSMSLYSGDAPGAITFKIDELLVLYLASGTNNVKDQIDFDVVPNPTLDGIFEVRCPEKISGIELFNPAGQLIKSYLPNDAAIILPEGKGLYIVRIKDGNGLSGIQKILRL